MLIDAFKFVRKEIKDARVIIIGSDIKISDEGVRIYNSYGYSDRYQWEGVDITGKDTEHIIGVNNLHWIECNGVNFAYTEGLNNNHIVIQFRRQNVN